MPTKTTATLAVLFFGLLVPATALATIHTGHFVWEEPLNGPSLFPQAPRIEQERSLREVSITYDDQAGSIIITAENYDPSHWDSLNTNNFALGPKCEETSASGEFSGLVSGEFSGGEQYEETKGNTAEAAVGTLNLTGYEGQLAVHGPFNGQTFSLTFTNPHLTNLELRCATMNARVNLSGETISETFLLSGYPTPSVASPLRTLRVTRAEMHALEVAASERPADAFNWHRHHFLSAKRTSNGWADAVWSLYPRGAEPETIIFEFKRNAWRVVTYGTSACEPGAGVPKSICKALDL